ncbi:MAG: isopenicillin N synthase family dioxygenase [Steroidobacteraceae bacterium]
MSEHIPTLSLRDVDSETFVHQLGDAYSRCGFVIITDHGISQTLIDSFLTTYQKFFAWPDAQKRRYHVAGGGGARGYTPFGIETAKGSTHSDLKEFWHVGRELPASHPYRHYMADNVWIDELAGFRDISAAMFEAFDLTGRRLLTAIARSLGLDRHYFEDKVQLGNSVLRVIHYPPMPAQPTESVRAGAHEDINVITLLLGAEEPGLQVLTRQGDWLGVNPPPGSMVVNVGDMLQRLTNGQLRSTTHRVVNPASDRARHARFSMPFFLHFNPDFPIAALPSCVGPGKPTPLPPILAEEYLQERLREIKLK